MATAKPAPAVPAAIPVDVVQAAPASAEVTEDATEADVTTDIEADSDAEQPEFDAELTDAFLADLSRSPVRMAHPDGGTCDRYATDKAGNLIVPSEEVASMVEHGFAVVEGDV